MKKRILTLMLMLTVLVQGIPSVAASTKKSPPKKTLIEGTIEIIDIKNRQITILDWNEKLHTVDLLKKTKIEDLHFGQEVKVNLEGKATKTIELIEEDDPTRDGYIPPGTRFRVGKVLFATNQNIEINTEQGREKYEIDPMSTMVYKKGMVAEFIQIKEGDRVLLTFDDIYSSRVSEIKIEDEEKHIEGVLKGKIEMIDERNKEIVISQPLVLNQGKWIPTTQQTKIKLGSGVIYEGNKKIRLANLQKRKGLETYIAYENSFGRQTVGKMLIKSGPSMEYKDLIQDIDYGTNQLVVSTNMFNLSDGTIVVKDNRLVDSLNLSKSQDIHMVSDYKNGIRAASVISIEGTTILDDRIDGSKLLIYKGKIEDILDYKLILGNNNYQLDKTIITTKGFTTNSSPEAMIFTEDTLIFDSELKKEIPVKSFMDSIYMDLIDVKDKTLRDRLEKDYYKNKPAYIVARETILGKEILAINLAPQDNNKFTQTVMLDYSSMGDIKAVDQGTKSLTLEKVNNYNTLTGRWEIGQDETIDLSQTIVLVNDKQIPIEEVYKIRKGSKGFLVKNKQTSKSTTYILLIED